MSVGNYEALRLDDFEREYLLVLAERVGFKSRAPGGPWRMIPADLQITVGVGTWLGLFFTAGSKRLGARGRKPSSNTISGADRFAADH
jgi:hypothetical protein